MNYYIDPLNLETIEHTIPSFYKVKLFDTIDSTNTYLSDHSNLDEGTVVIADSQHQGKGRNGRSFYSPKQTGIYLSLLIKPNQKPQTVLHYTALCAVSACKAIEDVYGFNPDIKWLNDIYFMNKKLGGILCEGKLIGNTYESLVLGIGLNVHSFIRPDDIATIAGSIEDFVNIKKSRNELIARFLTHFYNYYIHQTSFIDEYRNNLLFVNQPINVIVNNTITPAICKGVDQEFRLVVEYADGTIDYLSNGEVSIRSKIQS